MLDGVARVGLRADEHERILGAARKAAERDLAVAVAQRWEFGATTVSASVALSALASVSVFATGGLGGVHRGAELTFDVSADLDALAQHPVIAVSAGAKAFCARIPRDTVRCSDGSDWFPAFYTRSWAIASHRRVTRRGRRCAQLHRPSGVPLTVPIPEAAELDAAAIDGVLRAALADADAQGVVGAAITPMVLARIAEATAGGSIPANLALAERNAAVAGGVAMAVAASTGTGARA